MNAKKTKILAFNQVEITTISGGSRGAGRGPPIVGKVNLIFYVVYNVWKNILQIQFGFYSGRNPRSCWKCGGVCVCVWIKIVAATVFCSAKARFWIISEAILIPKIYARLQEIASNFSKFSGGGPQTPAGALAFGARFGASPSYRAPLSKIPGSAPGHIFSQLEVLQDYK